MVLAFRINIWRLLKGKKVAKFRQSMASLLQKCLDLDMGLADDIPDRALQAHMAGLQAEKGTSPEASGEIPRFKFRDNQGAGASHQAEEAAFRTVSRRKKSGAGVAPETVLGKPEGRMCYDRNTFCNRTRRPISMMYRVRQALKNSVVCPRKA